MDAISGEDEPGDRAPTEAKHGTPTRAVLPDELTPLPLDAVPDPLFERVWKVYTELGLLEERFNQTAAGCRSLASTWLLATFAGFGFVLSKKLPIDRWLLVGAIAIAGALGIGLLWNLDHGVYRRLLRVSFDQARHLEHRYQWLPQTRIAMMAETHDKGVGPRVRWFYLVPILLLVSLATIAFAVSAGHSAVISAAVGVVGAWAVGVAARVLWRGSVRAGTERV